MKEKFSRYLRIRRREGTVAVFHLLNPQPLYVTSETWNCFFNDAGRMSDLAAELKQRKLLIAADVDDDRTRVAAAKALEGKLNQTTSLYLVLAEHCNFECRYCPIPSMARHSGEKLLSAAHAIAGLNLWREHLRDAPEGDLDSWIIFYGGEPLLNIPVIREILDYIANLRCSGDVEMCRTNLLLVTNGLFVDEEVIRFSKYHNIGVAVSVDGPQRIHDRYRMDSNGNGTFDYAIAAIRGLVAGSVTTYASVTITPANIDWVSEAAGFLKGLGVERFGFNLLRGRQALELVSSCNLPAYYRKAAQAIVRNGLRGMKGSNEYQMEKKVTAFDRKDFPPHDCTCYGMQLVVLPDGSISNCPFARPRLEHVETAGADFRIAKTDIARRWQMRYPLLHGDFESTDAQALCGGGCAWSAYELTGDFYAVDDGSRILAEEAFDELIWRDYLKPRP